MTDAKEQNNTCPATWDVYDSSRRETDIPIEVFSSIVSSTGSDGTPWQIIIDEAGALHVPKFMTPAQAVFLTGVISNPVQYCDFSDSENEWMRNTWNRWMKGQNT